MVGVLTRWDLLMENNYEVFLSELISYLKANLRIITYSNGSKTWECHFSHRDWMEGYIQVDSLKHFKSFCKAKNYSWKEAFDVMSEIHNFYPFCDCDIIDEYERFIETKKNEQILSYKLEMDAQFDVYKKHKGEVK